MAKVSITYEGGSVGRGMEAEIMEGVIADARALLAKLECPEHGEDASVDMTVKVEKGGEYLIGVAGCCDAMSDKAAAAVEEME